MRRHPDAAFTYDALGRQLTQTIPIASVSNPVFTSEWDLAGRRTRYTWPVDASSPTAYYVDYDHLVTGEVSAIREKGATSGAGVLATYGYDDLGRRTGVTRGNGATTSYAYDSASRLGSMTHEFAGTTHDLTLGFGYNPASQIASSTRSNDLYSWTGHGSGTSSSSTNGLNQLATHGGATPTHDARGNLTSDGTFSYTYSSENLMTSGANSGTLGYDPLMRFYRSGSTYYLHEGGRLVGEYFNGSIVNRFVPGPGTDEPLVQVDKFGARTWYHSDERGSVIAGSDASGANARIVLFDEYGKRGSGGSYRIAYTGQPSRPSRGSIATRPGILLQPQQALDPSPGKRPLAPGRECPSARREAKASGRKVRDRGDGLVRKAPINYGSGITAPHHGSFRCRRKSDERTYVSIYCLSADV